MMGRRQSLLAAATLLAACLRADPGAAQETSAPVQQQALLAMEALQEELQVLAALRDAQAALLAWNRENARTGLPPAALPAALCDDPAIEAWCPLLPATFGGASTEDRDG